ncbi:MAG: hypothetical protein LBL52_01625 [Rickettsiales bacterium]|jgi:hypothetical protein|nr:hypothetical protein [Rickettsiales bacterium]
MHKLMKSISVLAILALAACGGSDSNSPSVDNPGTGSGTGTGTGSKNPSYKTDTPTNEDMVTLAYDLPLGLVQIEGDTEMYDILKYEANTYNENIGLWYSTILNLDAADPDDEIEVERFIPAKQFIKDGNGNWTAKTTFNFTSGDSYAKFVDGYMTTSEASDANNFDLIKLDVAPVLMGATTDKTGMAFVEYGYWKKTAYQGAVAQFTTFEPFVGGFETHMIDDALLPTTGAAMTFSGHAGGGINGVAPGATNTALSGAQQELVGTSYLVLTPGTTSSETLKLAFNNFYTFNFTNGGFTSIEGAATGDYATAYAGKLATSGVDTSNSGYTRDFYGRNYTPEEVAGIANLTITGTDSNIYYLNAAFGAKKAK